jgi:hypothetical protein
MNTALVTALNAEGGVLQKLRMIDDHQSIWSTIIAWLMLDGVAKLKIERFSGEDICQRCYEITMID